MEPGCRSAFCGSLNLGNAPRNSFWDTHSLDFGFLSSYSPIRLTYHPPFSIPLSFLPGFGYEMISCPLPFDLWLECPSMSWSVLLPLLLLTGVLFQYLASQTAVGEPPSGYAPGSAFGQDWLPPPCVCLSPSLCKEGEEGKCT